MSKNQLVLSNRPMPVYAGEILDHNLTDLVLVNEKDRKINLDPVDVAIVLREHQHISAPYVIDFLRKAQLYGANPRKNEIYLIPYEKNIKGPNGQWLKQLIASIVFSYQFFQQSAMATDDIEDWEAGASIQSYFNPVKGNQEMVPMGWCSVKRKKFKTPIRFEAFYPEFVSTNHEGKVNKMWAKAPYMMIRKCAIANAFRQAFPGEMKGMYLAEEMMNEADENFIPPQELASGLHQPMLNAPSVEPSQVIIPHQSRLQDDPPPPPPEEFYHPAMTVFPPAQMTEQFYPPTTSAPVGGPPPLPPKQSVPQETQYDYSNPNELPPQQVERMGRNKSAQATVPKAAPSPSQPVQEYLDADDLEPQEEVEETKEAFPEVPMPDANFDIETKQTPAEVPAELVPIDHETEIKLKHYVMSQQRKGAIVLGNKEIQAKLKPLKKDKNMALGVIRQLETNDVSYFA